MNIELKTYTKLSLIIIIGLFLRISASYFYGDTTIENEWGPLLNNLYKHGILSFEKFDGNLIPSVYMPPLYVYFLFFIKLVTPLNVNFVDTVIHIQIILSTISIFFFYRLNNFFFSKKWSLLNSFILSIFPLSIYSSSQISSISLGVFLLILFFYLLFTILKLEKKWIEISLFSFIAGLLMLLRGEFFLIFLITLIYIFTLKKINIKTFFIIIFISILVLSPYVIRNYITFNKITLTKSLGYNLWKGNNLYATVEGSESKEAFAYNNLDKKIENLPKTNIYDFHYNDLLLKEGINFIKNDPKLFLERFIKKFFSFFFFDLNANYPNYYHPFFIIPIIFLSFFSFLGILISLKNLDYKKGYLLLYLFLSISIFSAFFILPRYKLMIMPVQLIFMNYFLVYIFDKINFVKKK